MKTEFALALNQIGAERSLPREIITRVIETALVTSYRKNSNIMVSQQVAATVDIDSGDMRVYVEKEVVEDVLDDRTEVILSTALEQKPDAVVGDCIMVDVTPEDFGRIAAQNAKQLIVQKLREAERDYQFSQFSEREGEIVMGLVQSVTPTGLTVNLGRIEGILPRKEMLPNERYEQGKQVRAFVSEVKRSGRGPQITLSRTHKNMLRRLLEIEVPEIFDGKVEIKSITREPGSRSKVAVAALQANIDPVGACVGPRGTRIQGIINELSGEKIDVIEWSIDPAVYITKALGPAKVLAVHPSSGLAGSKNATVIVPDDQLSLAIGREGQNARLAARLTGWRIDIKSGTEALNESVRKLDEHPEIQASFSPDVAKSVPALRELMVRQRAQATPLSADEFLLVKRVVDAVYQHEVIQLAGAAASARPVVVTVSEPEQLAAMAAIPKASYTMPLEDLKLPARMMEHIQKAGIVSIGQLLELGTRGDEGLLSIEGIGSKAVVEIKQALDAATERAKAIDAEALVADEAPVVVVEITPVIAEVEVVSAIGEPGEEEEDSAKEFINAMAEGDEVAADDTVDSKKDKGKKSAKGALVFDEDLGRLVVQKAHKRRGDFDEDED